MSAVGQASLEPRFQSSPAAKDAAASPAKPPVETNATKTAIERLAVTRRAPQIMRRHLVRTAVRISVLMSGDAAALLLLRATLRGVRDTGW